MWMWGFNNQPNNFENSFTTSSLSFRLVPRLFCATCFSQHDVVDANQCIRGWQSHLYAPLTCNAHALDKLCDKKQTVCDSYRNLTTTWGEDKTCINLFRDFLLNYIKNECPPLPRQLYKSRSLHAILAAITTLTTLRGAQRGWLSQSRKWQLCARKLHVHHANPTRHRGWKHGNILANVRHD